MRGWVLSLLMVACAAPMARAEISLEAPSSIPAGSDYQVSWTGEGNERDFLTLVLAGTEEGKYASYVYARTNPVELRAPDDPGDYELRYLSKDGPYPTLARMAVTVTPVSATLEIPPAIAAGSNIPVTWTGPDNHHDFITIVAVGTPEKKYDTYVYTSKGSPVELRAPDEAGDYEVRYLTGQEYYTLAAAPITVKSTTATVSFPATVKAGSSFAVAWEGPDNTQDYVAIFPSGGPDNEYLSYQYTKKGSPLTMRAPEEEGSYDVRYMNGQSQTSLVSEPLEVGAVSASLQAPAEAVGGSVFSVRWSGPDNRGDFIGMAEAGAGERPRYATYVYTWRGNPAEMTAPLEPGDYELRYEMAQSSRILDRVAIRVTPPTLAPGTLVVDPPRQGEVLTLGSEDAVEIILDASGSMLQKQGGKRRIDIAKDVLQRLVTETIPSGTQFALRVFGHKETDSCRTDLEIAMRPLEASAVSTIVGGIEAMNLAKTPIARSLELVAEDLSAAKGLRLVVLITDGEETCDGDPAEVIESLKAAGVDVRVNIVGFAIDDAALKSSFRYWAELGDGGYHEAADAAGLAASLSAALRTPYEVRDSQDRVVAEGLVGGDPLTLPPGEYTVRTRTRPAFESKVAITSDKETRIAVSR